jgi:hypothetical protein
MEQDAVSDFDGEIIGRIASSVLRDEQKIPCAIELRCRERWICGRAQSEQKQPESFRLKGPARRKFFHCILLATTRVESGSGRRSTARRTQGAPTKA